MRALHLIPLLQAILLAGSVEERAAEALACRPQPDLPCAVAADVLGRTESALPSVVVLSAERDAKGFRVLAERSNAEGRRAHFTYDFNETWALRGRTCQGLPEGGRLVSQSWGAIERDEQGALLFEDACGLRAGCEPGFATRWRVPMRGDRLQKPVPEGSGVTGDYLVKPPAPPAGSCGYLLGRLLWPSGSEVRFLDSNGWTGAWLAGASSPVVLAPGEALPPGARLVLAPGARAALLMEGVRLFIPATARARILSVEEHPAPGLREWLRGKGHSGSASVDYLGPEAIELTGALHLIEKGQVRDKPLCLGVMGRVVGEQPGWPLAPDAWVLQGDDYLASWAGLVVSGRCSPPLPPRSVTPLPAK